MRRFYLGYDRPVAERFAETARRTGAEANVVTETDTARNEFQGYAVITCNHGNLDALAAVLDQPPFTTTAGTRARQPDEQLAALDRFNTTHHVTEQASVAATLATAARPVRADGTHLRPTR